MLSPAYDFSPVTLVSITVLCHSATVRISSILITVWLPWRASHTWQAGRSLASGYIGRHGKRSQSAPGVAWLPVSRKLVFLCWSLSSRWQELHWGKQQQLSALAVRERCPEWQGGWYPAGRLRHGSIPTSVSSFTEPWGPQLRHDPEATATHC